jgi:hypothetical protein
MSEVAEDTADLDTDILNGKGPAFVQVPFKLVGLLAEEKDKTLAVIMYLYAQGFRFKRPFKLPNGALEELGVSRKAKWRVLDVLERHGVIAIERRGRKSPIVTLLVRVRKR